MYLGRIPNRPIGQTIRIRDLRLYEKGKYCDADKAYDEKTSWPSLDFHLLRVPHRIDSLQRSTNKGLCEFLKCFLGMRWWACVGVRSFVNTFFII